MNMHQKQRSLTLGAMLFVTALFAFAPVEADEAKPHVVLVVGTQHYSPELSMPLFAKELERFGFRTTLVMGWVSEGTLYLTRLEGGCVPLLSGTGQGSSRLLEKDFGVILVNESEADIVAWAWQNEWGGKVFGTTLRHPADFGEASFTRMLVNSVCWATERPIPAADKKITTWELQRADKKP